MTSRTFAPASHRTSVRKNENTTGNSMRQGRSKLLAFAKTTVIISLYQLEKLVQKCRALARIRPPHHSFSRIDLSSSGLPSSSSSTGDDSPCPGKRGGPSSRPSPADPPPKSGSERDPTIACSVVARFWIRLRDCSDLSGVPGSSRPGVTFNSLLPSPSSSRPPAKSCASSSKSSSLCAARP